MLSKKIKMNVIISSAGRFWAFHLAEQLQKRKMLKFLFTQAHIRSSDNISAKKIKFTLRLKLLGFLVPILRLIPFLGKYTSFLEDYMQISHDGYVSEQICKIQDVNIFVGWAGNCLKSLKTAKKRGIKTIIECGSTHPLFHSNIIKEEYALSCGKKIKESRERVRQIKILLKEISICDYIAIPSRFVEDSFVQYGVSKKKLIRVPYGVNLASFKKIKKKDKVFRVIFCGSICIRKGIHYLLKAFYELNLPNSELMLIGYIDKDMQQFLKCYQRNNIKAIGPRPQELLYKYYSQGSVFVHPSVEEGLSLVQMEAMACGLPLISTTNTGAADIIRNGKEGFIVPIRDVSSLKSKLLYMYKNPNECKSMGTNAKKRVKLFTWDCYGEKMVMEYKKIAKNQN